ncbi:hypothetical protein BLNAU_6831 [Blattamonas nauphoetae]|uniref:Uncharacterized protein n=1 Tax=Blattamonas nauphoetae TaxID=2049346 RepID=A0ABQ9Y307_9EUKA|nr:hypothetical protein BLNAU_6831 [Blattamonas nauphoetae]
MNCHPFLNWDEKQLESIPERAVVFRSLAATVNLQPSLDVSLEAKAMKYLEYIHSQIHSDTERFLDSFGQTSAESLTNFIQSIGVLISSPSQVITTATMKMLKTLSLSCSTQLLLTLVQADLLPQIIASLNPHSLSFVESVDIHIYLIFTIHNPVWLATPDGLARLGIEEDAEQQAVHEMVLQQVVIPSEKYIWHLCVSRFSIVDGEQSREFLEFLVRLLQICPYYQPTMDFVYHMPVVLSIPSCLTFFEIDRSIYWFLYHIVDIQQEWNVTRGKIRQMWKTVHKMLRMEGIEDVLEAKLQNDNKRYYGDRIVAHLFSWNNMLGMNVN